MYICFCVLFIFFLWVIGGSVVVWSMVPTRSTGDGSIGVCVCVCGDGGVVV